MTCMAPKPATNSLQSPVRSSTAFLRRCFSGSNYDNTRGLHYAQGGCYIKTWAKHGPLMNPYAFGWFEHMNHTGYKPRFPQTMIIYEGGGIPQLEGQLVAGMALTRTHSATFFAKFT